MAEPRPPAVHPDALSILNVRNIVTVALLALAVYLMWLIRGVIAMFIAAMVISFLLYPSVRVLSETGIKGMKMSRALACVIVLVGSIGILGLGTFAIVNMAREQYFKFQTTLQDPSKTQELKVQATEFIMRYRGLLTVLGVDHSALTGEEPPGPTPDLKTALEEAVNGSEAPVEATANAQRAELETNLNTLLEDYLPNKAAPALREWVTEHANLPAILGGIGNAIAIIVGLPIIIFYMLKDSRQIRDTLMGFVPPAFTGATGGFLSALEATLSSYLRGQISLSLWIFVLDMILLRAFTDLDSWLILSLIAGITEIIPVVGPTIALVIACVVALVEGGGDAFVRVAIIFTFVQLIENQLLVPRIMGKELDVHPLTVMFFLMAGGILGGLVGALLSLPVAATLKVMLQQYYPGFIKRVEALLVDAPTPSAVIVIPKGAESHMDAAHQVQVRAGSDGPVILVTDDSSERRTTGGPIIVPGHEYSEESDRGE